MKNNKREMLLTSLVCLLPLFAGAALYRHCVRPAAVYFGTASRLLLRREP